MDFLSLRKEVLSIWVQVLQEKRPLDEVLDQAQKNLAHDEAQWVQEMASGVLRTRGRLDYVIDQFSEKKKPSGRLRKSLWMGVYSILFQDRVAGPVVVNEIVDLVKSLDGEVPSKFANALLRKVVKTAEQFKTWELQPGATGELGGAWGSIQPWMWMRLKHDWSEDWVKAYTKASLERPQTWVSGAAAPELLNDRKVSDTGSFVQDVSNQWLVAEVVEWIRFSFAGKKPRILDFCAAPGGKALGLAQAGFDVVATDDLGVTPRRWTRLQENVASHAAGKVEVMERSQFDERKNKFDWIWVDAPCLSSGLIRRHPDLRWNRSEKELQAMALVQQKVFDEALSSLAPGGWMVYTVCSVFRSEGQGQVEAFKKLAKKREIELKLMAKGVLAPHLSQPEVSCESTQNQPRSKTAWGGGGDGFQYLIFQA
jgi:16S rRNA (cytosine967-C5)-methyltransferase